MGFFDRLAGKKPAPPAASAAEPALATTAGGVLAQLAAARAKLEAKDLAGALAIYEEVLAIAGERADVLVTISGDLGSTGHVAPIVDLIAPRYDAERHGPATGLNLLQAYLALRHAEAAQHVLDILFSLNRPELEERLHGFSNAIAELIHEQAAPLAHDGAPGEPPAGAAKVALISLSKPIWFYGLEPLAGEILPAKEGKLRRIAFAQLALPGAYADVAAAMKEPADELRRLSHGLPLWLAETFCFSPHYAPVAAIGVLDDKAGGNRPVIFAAEWTTDNLRQLVETSGEGLDYIVTGALRQTSGAYELLLRIWEVKKFRERKTLTAHWTSATADAELTRLHGQVCAFMEWAPAKNSGLTWAAPAAPRAWLDTLAHSLAFFLAEKNLLPAPTVAEAAPMLAHAAAHAARGEAESCAFLTLRARAEKLALVARLPAALAASPLVAQAEAIAPPREG